MSMTEQAMKVLENLRDSKRPKEKRLNTLLRDPEEEYTTWFMCIPRCFNDALDIRRTIRKVHGREELVWTQGANFAFKVGDTLYDSKEGYTESWGHALRVLKRVIQVKAITDTTRLDETKKKAPSNVTFDVFLPNGTKTELGKPREYTLPQDDFVRFLIIGPEMKTLKEWIA
jgi:hypothetical protein